MSTSVLEQKNCFNFEKVSEEKTKSERERDSEKDRKRDIESQIERLDRSETGQEGFLWRRKQKNQKKRLT